jgi:hypothetical protein
LQSDYVNLVIEKPAYALIKLSVLFFYRRIFMIRPYFRYFNTAMIVLISLWGLGFFWAEVFACGTDFPVQWKERTQAPAHCTDHGTELFVFAITDLIGDVLIVLMPFLVIRDLKMTRKEKWAVSVVFLFGTLSTAAAILRTTFIVKAWSIGQMDWEPPPGTAPEIGGLRVVNPAFWTLVEVAIGVIAANLPPLGPLLRRAPSPRKFLSYTRHKLSLPYGSNRTHSKNTTSSSQLEKGYSRSSTGTEERAIVGKTYSEPRINQPGSPTSLNFSYPRRSNDGVESRGEIVPPIPALSIDDDDMRASAMYDEVQRNIGQGR